MFAPQLGLDLLGRDEQVGVVLGEAADAGHAGQLAGLLEAIDGAELGEPHRQVAVAARLRLVDLDVVRTVHRLEQVAFLVLEPVQQRLGPLARASVALSYSGSFDVHACEQLQRRAVDRLQLLLRVWPRS